MTTRAMGPIAGFSWLKQAINQGGGNPKAVFGGAALLMLMALLPTFVQLAVQAGLGAGPGDTQAAMVVLGLSVLYSLLVMGPLFAGYLRLLHANESGAPVHATAIFQIFQAGQGAGRVILVLLAVIVLGLLLFGAIAMAFGGDFFAEMAVVMQALESAEPGETPAMPALPSGTGTLFALLFIVGVFFNGVYSLALGQAALGRAGVGQSLADGLLGALKNLLPLLVLTIAVLVAGLIAVFALALGVALLMALGGFIHPALGMVLAAPLYFAAMVALYVVMFGVIYAMWRDVCGGEAAPADGKYVAKPLQYDMYVNSLGAVEAVKKGWSWPAFFFGFVWALVKHLWLVAILTLPVWFFFGVLSDVVERMQNARFSFALLLVGLILQFLFGLFGNRWRENSLRTKGFTRVAAVQAVSVKAALESYQLSKPRSDELQA